MAYCPNDECPERLATGSRQEFRAGVEMCSACGTRLRAGDPPLEGSERPRLGGSFSPFPGIASGMPEIVPETPDVARIERTTESEAPMDEEALALEASEEADLEAVRGRFRKRLDRFWQVLALVIFTYWLLRRWLE